MATYPRRNAAGWLVAVLSAVLIASGATPAAATTVQTDSQLRAAFSDPNETSITLTQSIDLTDCVTGALTRTSATGLTITGGGFTVHQTCAGKDLMDVNGGGTLTLNDVVAVDDGTNGVSNTASVTLNDSTIRGPGGDGPATGVAVPRAPKRAGPQLGAVSVDTDYRICSPENSLELSVLAHLVAGALYLRRRARADRNAREFYGPLFEAINATIKHLGKQGQAPQGSAVRATSDLAEQVAAGKTITLLCSSACTDPTHCHRTLLKQLIEEQLSRLRLGDSAREAASGDTVTAPSQL